MLDKISKLRTSFMEPQIFEYLNDKYIFEKTLNVFDENSIENLKF